MKNLFAKLKTFFDAYKMYVFFTALLFGTNGAQMYANNQSEPVEQATTASAPQKTIIIHKADNSYCDKKLDEHKTGAQH